MSEGMACIERQLVHAGSGDGSWLPQLGHFWPLFTFVVVVVVAAVRTADVDGAHRRVAASRARRRRGGNIAWTGAV